MIKIHGLILSPFVRKVMAVAKLKKLAFESVKVFPGTRTTEFLRPDLALAPCRVMLYLVWLSYVVFSFIASH